MHSPSALTEHVSMNLARFPLLDPVDGTVQRRCQKRFQNGAASLPSRAQFSDFQTGAFVQLSGIWSNEEIRPALLDS